MEPSTTTQPTFKLSSPRSESWPSTESYFRERQQYIDRHKENCLLEIQNLDDFVVRNNLSQRELDTLADVLTGAEFSCRKFVSRYLDSRVGSNNQEYDIAFNIYDGPPVQMGTFNTYFDTVIRNKDGIPVASDEEIAQARIIRGNVFLNITTALIAIRSGGALREVQALHESATIHECIHAIQEVEVFKKEGDERVRAFKEFEEDAKQSLIGKQEYIGSSLERSTHLWERKFLRKYYPDIYEKYSSKKIQHVLRRAWTDFTTNRFVALNLSQTVRSKDTFRRTAID